MAHLISGAGDGGSLGDDISETKPEVEGVQSDLEVVMTTAVQQHIQHDFVANAFIFELLKRF